MGWQMDGAHRLREANLGRRSLAGEGFGRTLVIAALLALLATACGDESPAAQPTSPTTSAATTTPTTTMAPTTAAPTTTATPTAVCSASESSPTPALQAGLPPKVAETRLAIVAAAVKCNFEALAEVALEGSALFTYSFGEDGDPATFWEDAEDRGADPMRFLVGVLNSPFGEVEVQGAVQYVWPSAFSYPDWESVPEADRDALLPLYDDNDLADFALFGSYIGYRVGITEKGDWVSFVAGD